MSWLSIVVLVDIDRKMQQFIIICRWYIVSDGVYMHLCSPVYCNFMIHHVFDVHDINQDQLYPAGMM